MKRRAFLKTAAAAPVAASTVINQAIAETTESLDIPGVNFNSNSSSLSGISTNTNINETAAILQEELNGVLNVSKEQEYYDELSYYTSALTPNAYSLRSVSLVNKIRMTHKELYKQYRVTRIRDLQRNIAKLLVKS